MGAKDQIKLCVGNNPQHQNTLSFVRTHWPIVAALAAGLIAWGVTTERLAVAEKTLDHTKVQITLLQNQLQAVREDSIKVQTNQERNKEQLDRIDDKIDRILEALQNEKEALGASQRGN